MSPILKDFAEHVALACELISVAFVAFGVAEAIGRMALRWRDCGDLTVQAQVWRRLAVTILLSLEFALAAEIARTAIAPSWGDIGRLAAIAGIRTVLYRYVAGEWRYFGKRKVATKRRPQSGPWFSWAASKRTPPVS
jgi:uncharacterized membrane protein